MELRPELKYATEATDELPLETRNPELKTGRIKSSLNVT
jgi:hypothetical protein